jgi:hypothetical protein
LLVVEVSWRYEHLTTLRDLERELRPLPSGVSVEVRVSAPFVIGGELNVFIKKH